MTSYSKQLKLSLRLFTVNTAVLDHLLVVAVPSSHLNSDKMSSALRNE